MVTLLIVLLIIFCVALGFFVLIQNPKGGGLATGGAGSNMFGVQRTGDVLEKGTWVLLALVVVASIALTTVSKTDGGSVSGGDSKIDSKIDQVATPSPIGGNAPKSAAPIPGASTAKDTTKK